MERWHFVDLATKAKELGITEATLRARVLSGKEDCFAFVANAFAYAEKGNWLPAWTPDAFPLVEWVDHGSEFRRDSELEPRHWRPNRTPLYHVTGWVALASGAVEYVLTRGEIELNQAPVCVTDSEGTAACWLWVNVDPKQEWVSANSEEYIAGGYWRETPIALTAADLFMLAADGTASKALSSRKEQSYLGIIAAMRALLRDKDGGGFPSEAKIIEQLVERFGRVDGVSKRNLEKVFPDATRAAGDLLGDK